MSSQRNISVQVKQGTVIGEEDQLINGQPYFAFKGIPYAAAPVGSLRFQPPQSLEKFPENTLDCRKERDVSLQKDVFTNNLIGSENCLFLNIYTPKLKSNNPLPVMVYIHGGAFLFGSGNAEFYFPKRLIEEDVIVVTLNYRLGILGFSYLPEGGIPGNVGLKDQLAALKWVNENISKFNGDPNNITLFGQSAGGASIHLHLLSKQSTKYFHKAILQSGTSNMEWVLQNNPIDRTRRLAKLLGCTSQNDKEIGEFLRHYKNPVEMMKHLLNTLTPDERRRGLPMPFRPVVEQDDNDDVIVPKDPVTALSELNSIGNKPVIMGYTSKEGITMLLKAATKLDVIDQDLECYIPRRINILPDDPRCHDIAKEMRNFYFNGEHLSEKLHEQLADLLSDYHFTMDCNAAAEFHAKRQHKSPLYFYRFSYDGNLNMYKKWFQFEHIKGACHGDELFYLFQTEFTKYPEKNSKDDLVIQKLCRLWANFAKFSNPTPNSCDNTIDFKWNPVKNINDKEDFTLDYLEMNEHFEMKKNPDEKRITFWRNIFKKWNSGFLKPKL